MFRNLKLFKKLALLALMIPLASAIMAGFALTETGNLKYEYDNLYGFMLIPIMDLDQAHLHHTFLEANLDKLAHEGSSLEESAALVESVKSNDQAMTTLISRYEEEWLTGLSPEFTASLAAQGQQQLQNAEADALHQFNLAYADYALKRDTLLSGQRVDLDTLKEDLAQMGVALESLVKINRQFADLSNTSAQATIGRMRLMLIWLPRSSKSRLTLRPGLKRRLPPPRLLAAEPPPSRPPSKV